MDVVARLEDHVARDLLRPPVADEDTDPRALAERELGDPAAARESLLADHELQHLGEVLVDATERNPEPPRNERERATLHDDREEDDDEHDPVELRPSSTPASSASAPSRMGTAPLRPPQAMKARSPQVSRETTRKGSTASGLATNARISASTSP